MYRIGIDLGGTNIAVGVVDSGYHLISETSVPAGAGRPAEQVVADMCRAVELALDMLHPHWNRWHKYVCRYVFWTAERRIR